MLRYPLGVGGAAFGVVLAACALTVVALVAVVLHVDTQTQTLVFGRTLALGEGTLVAGSAALGLVVGLLATVPGWVAASRRARRLTAEMATLRTRTGELAQQQVELAQQQAELQHAYDVLLAERDILYTRASQLARHAGARFLPDE